MKKPWLALSLVMLLASSCEDQLELTPLDRFEETTFWTTESNAMLALNAVYRGTIFANAPEYNPNDWWDYNGLIWMELGTDNAYPRTGDNAAQNRLTNGTLNGTVGILGNYWTNSYSRIARCNDFLENIGQVTMDETKKQRMIAEVKFIRACQYFYMSQFWGSVPLITNTLTAEEANVVTKASKQEVVNFVIKEFTDAAAALPRHKDIPTAEIGRASKQAALAFLGRIQLSEKMFSDAANTYETIIDFNDNIIDSDYSSIFLERNENSNENIFSTQFVPNLLSNAIMRHFAPSLSGGFNLLNPLANLMEAYQFTDGTSFSYTDTRYDANDIGKNRDPRLRYTILYNNAPFGANKYISHPDVTNTPDRTGATGKTATGYGMKKYIDETFTGNYNTQYGGNIPIIRFAEVLLSYLEAKLEAGQAITQADLDATINRVRGRSTVNLPSITVTDPVALRPILRNERRVELALEGIRYWDLLRWGIARDVLKGDFYGHPFPDAKTAIRKKNANTPVDQFRRWFVTTRNFRKGTDEVWPIPQSEININPNLAK